MKINPKHLWKKEGITRLIQNIDKYKEQFICFYIF